MNIANDTDNIFIEDKGPRYVVSGDSTDAFIEGESYNIEPVNVDHLWKVEPGSTYRISANYIDNLVTHLHEKSNFSGIAVGLEVQKIEGGIISLIYLGSTPMPISPYSRNRAITDIRFEESDILYVRKDRFWWIERLILSSFI